jgi:hypothetical protein
VQATQTGVEVLLHVPDKRMPVVQVDVQGWQALSPATALNVPDPHDEQTKFDVPEHDPERAEPAGHVFRHGWHTRSDVAVGATVWYEPEGHTVQTVQPVSLLP